ncbi:MAG: HAD family phosphatase [Pirellulaceae bacterium]
MPIRFLYFDMGNVLLSFSHQRAAAQMAAVAGITVERTWEIVFDAGLQWEYERGAINCGQFYHLFCLETGCRPDPEALDQAGSAIFELLPRIVPILAALRRSGYRLGVLSNTSPSHWRYVTSRFPFLREFFEIHALSYEAGAMKANAAIYEAAERMAAARGREIFFTDDREENVAAARSRGWEAELFTSPLELVSALSARGIAIPY